MKSNYSAKYPVFEADQVLSQKHLNNITSYLEEQDRITRVGAIGIGIVCGMKISNPTANTIKISCGAAITSLGYQIQWEEQVFTHYWDDELSQKFLQPNLSQEPYLNAIYQYVTPYASLKNCKELLPATSEIPTKSQLTQAFLQNKIVLLLLEISLIDQKNCLTTNCDDKGKRLELKVRPLVVDVEELENILLNQIIHPAGKPITSVRWNVPKKNIKTGVHLVAAYADIIEGNIQKDIEAKSKHLAQCFKNLSGKVKDFEAMLDVAEIIEKTIEKNSKLLHFQYVWDWLKDLAAAYNEILNYYKIHCRTLCCANEALFPFHVLLGYADRANVSPNQLNKPILAQRIRTPWIPTASQCSSNEMQMLILFLNRYTYILKNFKVPDYSKTHVKIIPGLYGKYQLSEKTIPYYYAKVDTLVKYWNPQQRLLGLQDSTLSYFASTYTNDDQVINPLLYDLESYNYFRIEGHIGKNYKDVLKSILDQQQNFQLPFHVIALNATNLLNNKNGFSNATIDWADLELDYDLVRRDYENIIGKSKEWLLKNRESIEQYFDRKKKNEFDLYLQLLEVARKSMEENFVDFLPIYGEFIETYESIENISTFHREHIFDLLQRSGTKNDNRENFLMEDLIDHLDAVINVCQKGEFRALFQAALERYQSVQLNLMLSEYIKKHPGMEHIAGVTKGGTFIIVYQDRRRIKPKRPARKMASTDLVAAAKRVASEEIEGFASAAMPSAAKVEMKARKSDTDSDDDKMKEFVSNMSSYVSNYLSPEYAIPLIAYMVDFNKYERATEDELTDALPAQLVIADFYLPYICCGDGDNVNITIVSQKPDTPNAIGDFSANDFKNPDFKTKNELIQ